MIRTLSSKVIFIFLIALSSSCGSEQETSEKKEIHLTKEERDLCEAVNVDSSLIKLLRERSSATLELFKPEPLWIYLEDGTTEERPSKLRGLVFEATQDAAKRHIGELSANFQKNGHTIYLCEENFGIDNLKDKVAIVNTADKYEILRETGTDGINYDIDNDSLLKIIRTFDEKYQLTLIGCNNDWCEFTFEKEPTNWIKMAEECYAVCPDIVDQGTETVEILAEELKRTKTLYFWWD